MRSIGLRDGWRGIAGRGMVRGVARNREGGDHKTSKKALQSKLKGGQQYGVKNKGMSQRS